MSKKIEYKVVKEEFEKHGFSLLENDYIGINIKMNCLCKCGRLHQTAYKYVKKGTGFCPLCTPNQRHEYSFIKQKFEERNCDLISKTYENAHAYLDYRCSCGSLAKTTWHTFKHGGKCINCFPQRMAEQNKDDIEYIKLFFKEQECQLLETVFVNHHTPINYICKCGNKTTTIFMSFKISKSCKECGYKRTSEAMSSNSVEFIQKSLVIHGHDNYDYSKVDYKAKDEKVIIICKKLNHGEFLQRPDSHLQGNGCPKCRESHGERIIRKWLTTNDIQFESQWMVKEDFRLIFSKFDFMAFRSDGKQILIEFNGSQHYVPEGFRRKATSEDKLECFKNCIRRDEVKRKWAEKHGYEILVIPCWEIKNTEKILEQYFNDQIVEIREIREPPNYIKKHTQLLEEIRQSLENNINQ